MLQFCQDRDLVKWEPFLFRDCRWGGQTLSQGQGSLSSSQLADSGGLFVIRQVKPGHVAYLYTPDGEYPTGSYEITAVNGEGMLTLSVIRGSEQDAVIPVADYADIHYRIVSFDPQSYEAGVQLLEYFAIAMTETAAGEGAEPIANRQALRQAAVFAVLAAVLAAQAREESEAGEADRYWERSSRYQQLFQTSRTKIRLLIDRDGDTHADEALSGGSPQLRRD